MKHARLGILVLPLLLAAGCELPKLPQVATPDNTPTTKTDWPGAPSVAAYTFADKWSENGVDRCQYVMTYPELTHPRVWTQEEPAKNPVLERANREIMRTYGLLSATGTIALTPEEIANEFMDMCRGDIEDMKRELGAEAVEHMMYVDDSTFTIHLLNEKMASLTIETYQYTGGAHGNPGILPLNIDLATGQKLMLADIVKHDQLQAVIKSAYRELLKRYEDGLFEEARTDINTIVNNQEQMPEQRQVEEFGNMDNVFLTGDGLMFVWNTYDITPYAAGQPMIFIPWSELEGKLALQLP